MNHDVKSMLTRLKEFGSSASNKGLIWGNSGNISHRLDEKKFIITGSSVSLEKLCDKDFVTVNLEDEKWKGEAKPSIETRMHTEIYRARENVNAVFHSQPFFTTFISCTNLEVDSKLFPESMAYIDRIERIAYYHPGSIELAKAVSEKIKDCDALILSNHGAVCVADSLGNVLLKTVTLELLCRIVATSRIGNIGLNFLPQSVRDEFLRHLMEMK